jgi:hypothetical protein
MEDEGFQKTKPMFERIEKKPVSTEDFEGESEKEIVAQQVKKRSSLIEYKKRQFSKEENLKNGSIFERISWGVIPENKL